MTFAAVPAIERLRVCAVQPMERGRQTVSHGRDDEVVVVRHQAEREEVQPLASCLVREPPQEAPGVAAHW